MDDNNQHNVNNSAVFTNRIEVEGSNENGEMKDTG